MTSERPLSPNTRTVHHDAPHGLPGRPVSVPIYQSSVFAHDNTKELTDALDDPRGGFAYSRNANPTVRALETAVAGLEGGIGGVATASGMGAIAVALGPHLHTGAHLVVQSSIYGGTTALLRDLISRFDLGITEVEAADPAAVASACTDDTTVVYLETISNPITGVADIAGAAAAVRDRGIVTVVDNTFATPLLCKPLDLGADVVLHSATKYLGGHSDVTAGVVVYRDEAAFRAGWAHAVVTGVTPDPFAAWLVLRGMQTLALRMRTACANADELAARLAGHPAVTRVHHPSRLDHPQHALATRTLAGFGAMLSFDLAGGRHAARRLTEAVRLIVQAPSLGGVETLVMHPASASHRAYSAEALAAAGIDQGTVRLSVGIEDVDDLWADLEQALAG